MKKVLCLVAMFATTLSFGQNVLSSTTTAGTGSAASLNKTARVTYSYGDVANANDLVDSWYVSFDNNSDSVEIAVGNTDGGVTIAAVDADAQTFQVLYSASGQPSATIYANTDNGCKINEAISSNIYIPTFTSLDLEGVVSYSATGIDFTSIGNSYVATDNNADGTANAFTVSYEVVDEGATTAFTGTSKSFTTNGSKTLRVKLSSDGVKAETEFTVVVANPEVDIEFDAPSVASVLDQVTVTVSGSVTTQNATLPSSVDIDGNTVVVDAMGEFTYDFVYTTDQVARSATGTADATGNAAGYESVTVQDVATVNLSAVNIPKMDLALSLSSSPMCGLTRITIANNSSTANLNNYVETYSVVDANGDMIALNADGVSFDVNSVDTYTVTLNGVADEGSRSEAQSIVISNIITAPSINFTQVSNTVGCDEETFVVELDLDGSTVDNWYDVAPADISTATPITAPSLDANSQFTVSVNEGNSAIYTVEASNSQCSGATATITLNAAVQTKGVSFQQSVSYE